MLNKNISLMNGLVIAIAMLIGTGLFGLPGLAIQATDPITALAGWGLVILLMPPFIHIFSCLGRQHPSSEGLSLYASMGFGAWSKWGVMLLTCGTLVVGMPAFLLVGGSYIARLFNLDSQTWAAPCAIALAAVTTGINLIGLEKLGLINKLVVLLVLATIAIISFHTLPDTIGAYRNIDNAALFRITPGGLWLAASLIFWAFQGWENMTFGFGEIKNPQRNIPLIFWLSFLLVSIIYGIFAVTASAAAIQGKNVTGLAGISNLLPAGMAGKIMLTVMVLVLIANANSWVFSSSRAFYSAATDGLLPRHLAKTNAQGIPANCLVISLLVYILIILIMWMTRLKEEFVFLLTTQGFILLYGGAILAFFKISRGLLNRVAGVLAIAGWGFLMQGFGWMIVYPLALLAIGTFAQYKYMNAK